MAAFGGDEEVDKAVKDVVVIEDMGGTKQDVGGLLVLEVTSTLAGLSSALGVLFAAT